MTPRLYAKYLARKAQDLVAEPSNWIRGYTMATDQDDTAVPYYDTAATKFNVVGALERASTIDEGKFDPMGVPFESNPLELAICMMASAIPGSGTIPSYGGRKMITDYANSVDHGEIMRWFTEVCRPRGLRHA